MFGVSLRGFFEEFHTSYAGGLGSVPRDGPGDLRRGHFRLKFEAFFALRPGRRECWVAETPGFLTPRCSATRIRCNCNGLSTEISHQHTVRNTHTHHNHHRRLHSSVTFPALPFRRLLQLMEVDWALLREEDERATAPLVVAM